ncbi:MAG TPA: type III secretion system cytoplasmic ring protein SctQ [Candidatus Thiothrix moscowensis]|uniref:type III secretion system cytoplasmic ring protein SctQ n=1 Tax=unclassified Thiothrix TaxID=2636184 RepID=UPI0025DF5A8B|nr:MULTISPECIES: type III secretion system cytoplasmic ring protein SctQ [unclassified Thiothrix]HRJ54055.1 type III secretion system cytoplasmic ring protein SctQ [Candidatus Thiothrix moscowensis]HRJ94201.1 type III secretion system cytoplasmic ring protein SctQ [Candidatus Thiothrix moscowensis]
MSVIIKNSQAALKPLPIPKLDVPSVRLNNLLMNKTQAHSFALANGKLISLRLLPGSIQTLAQCPIGLTISLGNTTAGLWLSAWPQPERIRQLLPDGMLEKLPENLALSVIESSQAPLLEQAERALQLRISLQSLFAEPNTPLYTLPFGFEMQETDPATQTVHASISGLLVIDPQLYPHLQERLRAWPSTENEDWDAHTTSVHFEISRQSFSMAEINQLQLADILLLPDAAFHEYGIIRLRLDSGVGCSARFTSTDKNALTITSEWNAMSDNETKTNINHIAQLPVQLSFDLGEKTLSFNEVRQLRPGHILELSASLPELVQIRSHNRLVGSGELVDINGRVGVRILKLFGKQGKGG